MMPKGFAAKFSSNKKEDLNCRDDDRGVGEQSDVGLIPQPEDEPVSGEQQRPEQQRSFLS